MVRIIAPYVFISSGNTMREFSYSETFIKQTDRIFLILFCFIAVCLVIFALYFSNLSIEKTLIVTVRTLLLLGIIFLVQPLLINRRLRKLKVLIYEDKLVRQCGKKQQTFMWDDITRIKVIEKKNGNVVGIRLYTKKPAVTIHLFAFREIGDLTNLIKERTFGKVILQEKHWKINWLNPNVSFLIGGVPAMIVMAVICSMGSKAMDIFAIFVAFAVGLFLLIFRPLKKCDIFYNKWIELAFGAVFLIWGLYGLIVFLLYGKLR